MEELQAFLAHITVSHWATSSFTHPWESL